MLLCICPNNYRPKNVPENDHQNQNQSNFDGRQSKTTTLLQIPQIVLSGAKILLKLFFEELSGDGMVKYSYICVLFDYKSGNTSVFLYVSLHMIQNRENGIFFRFLSLMTRFVILLKIHSFVE